MRGTRRWLDSSDRLDDLNAQIMHEGTFDPSTDDVAADDANRPTPARHADGAARTA